MHWLIFAGISVLTSSFSSIVRRRLMGQVTSDPMTVAVLVQIFGGIMAGSFALSHGFRVPPLEGHLLNYIIMTIFWGVSSYCVYVAYKYIEAGEATLLGSFSSVMSIAGGVLVLHEVFKTQHLIGSIFILTAVGIVAFDGIRHFKINKGFYYALIAALFAGMAIVNDAFMLRNADALSYLAIAYLIPATLMLLLQFKKIVFTLHHHKRNFWAQIGLQSILSCVSAGAYYSALEFGAPASQLSPIGQSTVIFTVLFGVIFLGERNHLYKKLFCAGLVFVGVLLLG